MGNNAAASADFVCFAAFLDEFVGLRVRHGFVVFEFHAEAGAALRERADVARVAEHFAERNFCADDFLAAARVHRFDASAALRERAGGRAHEVFGRGDFDIHDRFEQQRRGFEEGFFERDAACFLERDVAGVNVVIGAVVERDVTSTTG